MKWSKAWDDARFNGGTWTKDAWTSNEWNGKLSGGSGEVWHYKIVWLGRNCKIVLTGEQVVIQFGVNLKLLWIRVLLLTNIFGTHTQVQLDTE